MLSELSMQFLELLKSKPTPQFKIRDFTVPELDRFRELCNFTEDERAYFDYKADDKSNVYIADKMNISEAQVSKLARRVKIKIIRVA